MEIQSPGVLALSLLCLLALPAQDNPAQDNPPQDNPGDPDSEVPIPEVAVSPIRPDETVILFRTTARLVDAGPHPVDDGTPPDDDGTEKLWQVPVHGWIHEPESESRWRRGVLAAFRKKLGLESDSEENQLFRKRAALFLVDNEGGKELTVIIGDAQVSLEPSGSHGHFKGELRLPLSEARPGETLTATIHAPDGRRFEGQIHCARERGLAVISDLDDTVKISEVHSKRALLRNTFLRPFRPVEDLADRYREWEAAGARFEYLSASPWQLYPSLHDFLGDAGYPAGALHLKRFRVKDQSFFSLFAKPEKTKLPILERLLAEHPEQRFMLVGDSGERDPEIYGEIARRYPDRIHRIIIRELEASALDPKRRAEAFREVPEDTVIIFQQPGEIPEGLAQPSK